MMFHIEERRAWFRPRSHTIVLDRDPEFRRLADDDSGSLKRLLRIWLAEGTRRKPILKAYIGTICLSDGNLPVPELLKLCRRVSDCASEAGETRKTLRLRLAQALREYLARDARTRRS